MLGLQPTKKLSPTIEAARRITSPLLFGIAAIVSPLLMFFRGPVDEGIRPVRRGIRRWG